ncbi:MAG: TauD/TfdA family dioxygenase [Myxococcales bacterium]|nr:TauD/TfdA family dioxygenase [Myxococcales bacterium]
MKVARFSEELPFLGVVRPPASVRAREDLVRWGGDEREALRAALTRHGALLLRGFPLQGPGDFNAFFKSQESAGLSYAGGFTVRERVDGEVYTSTAAPPMVSIPLHNEMAYLPDHPDRVYLFCEQPARSGGQTPIADGRRVLAGVDPALVERLRERGVRYIRNLAKEPGKIWPTTGWRRAFACETREEAEAAARAAGCEVDWHGDLLRVAFVGPLTVVHPETGDEAWFSQLHNFHHSNSAEFLHARKLIGWLLFRWIEARERARVPEDRLSVAVFDGAGEPITRAEALGVRRTIWREARRFDWRAGDLLITDNRLVLHGRLPYRGARRVYAALARD